MKVNKHVYCAYNNRDTVLEALIEASTLGFKSSIFSCKNREVKFIHHSNDCEKDLWSIHLNNEDKFDDDYFAYDVDDDHLFNPSRLDNELPQIEEFILLPKSHLIVNLNLQ